MAQPTILLEDNAAHEHREATPNNYHFIFAWTVSNLDLVSAARVQLLSDETVIWGPIRLPPGSQPHTVKFGKPIYTAIGESLSAQVIGEGPGTAGVTSSVNAETAHSIGAVMGRC